MGAACADTAGPDADVRTLLGWYFVGRVVQSSQWFHTTDTTDNHACLPDMQAEVHQELQAAGYMPHPNQPETREITYAGDDSS